MIELPPQQASVSTTASGEVKAVDAKVLVSQTLKATVLEVNVRQESISSAKPLYDILMQAQGNRAPTSQPAPTQPMPSSNQLPVISQITPEVIQQLRSGQAMLIKTVADFPLPTASALSVVISTSKGVVIQQPIAPTAQQTLASTMKQWMPYQNSVAPLLANLHQLISNPAQLNALPPLLQQRIVALAGQIPFANQIKQPGHFENAIKNNGTFFENKLKNLIETVAATKENTVKDHQASGQSFPNASKAGLQRLNETFRHISQKVLDGAGLKTVATAQSPTTSTTSTSVERAVITDLKHQLQKLEQALQTAVKHVEKPTDNTVANESKPLANSYQPAGKTAATPPLEKVQQDPSASLNKLDEKTLVNKDTKSAFVPDQKRMMSSSSSAYQSSAITQAATTVTPLSQSQPSVGAHELLLPPLPGMLFLQPTPRAQASLKGNEMADALISILLKQVTGAIARMTLHQLTSQSRQSDAPNTTVLNFEIPFNYQNSTHIFQFRIEEEDESLQQDDDGKQYGKRWVVQMAFDIEGLGPMLCQISLLGQGASVSFWAEWKNTLEHTKKHFDFLEHTLTEMGLRVEKLQGHLGIPKSDRTLLHNQLVDIKT